MEKIILERLNKIFDNGGRPFISATKVHNTPTTNEVGAGDWAPNRKYYLFNGNSDKTYHLFVQGIGNFMIQ